MASVSYSEAHNFFVGWKEGWVLDPSHESFNHRAERHRFQVNDTLVSKFDPIQSVTDGESIFKFGHSGPFFFISSNVNNCQNGQKLISVVLALKHNLMSDDHEHIPVPSPPVASPDSGSNPSSLNNAPTRRS